MDMTSAARRLGGAAETLRCERLRDADTAAWEAYLSRDPRASLYHSAKWAALIERVFGHETCYWLARDDSGEVVGVLPLVRLKSWLFGDFMASMPYFNYGGALGRDALVEDALMRAAAEDASARGIDHIEFRDTTPRDGAWRQRQDKVVMHLTLPDQPEVLWKQIGSKLRAQIRRPQKEGAEVVCGGMELLDDFYSVFSRNMRDLGTPIYPKRFFQVIAETFAERLLIVVVRIGGRPAAAGFLLGHGELMEIPWASSLREYNRIGVNMLLYWRALHESIRRGYRVFDFGRSSIGGGTYRFKKQWGAEPVQLYWHYWLGRGRSMPNLSPDNPKYRLAVRVWQSLPLAVANRLGPHLVKYLP